MINYGRQTLNSLDYTEVLKVLKSDFITQGKIINNFEKQISSKFGSKYCTVVSNGTAALHLAGLSLGWKENDIILTSPLSFLASANCILYCNATPDFADINEKTFTIDPNNVEDRIKFYKKKGKRIKSIIAIDYAGHPSDWKALRFLSNKHNISLINDNCHALGSFYNGTDKYAVKYADLVTHSYHPVKAITTGEGGSILTNNKDINSKVKSYRNHGIEKNKNMMKKKGLWHYEMIRLGYNYRITDFQCALGISQLKKLDFFIKKRNNIAKKYNKSFENNSKFLIPYIEKNVLHSFHLYPLQIKFNKIKLNKKNFFLKMKKSGINLMVHYIPIHLQPYYKKKFQYKNGDYPIAENFFQSECSLPIFPNLNDNDQNFVINKILQYAQ